MIEEKVIEIAPLAFMRGRTLSHAFVVLDEAQNATSMQMKMFLTRLGEGSRMVVTGDRTQIDLPRGVPSGLGTWIGRPDDTMSLASGKHPAFEVGLLRTAVAAPVDRRRYDPVLPDATFADWRSQGVALTEYPKGVFVVESPHNTDGVWVMCTDSGRSNVYLVSSAYAPRAAVAK